MTGPEDGSNKQQCFSLYYSAISQYYGVDLCQKKVPTDPWAINLYVLYQTVFPELLTLNGTMTSVSLKGYNVQELINGRVICVHCN
jgi:hypothetical protein